MGSDKKAKTGDVKAKPGEANVKLVSMCFFMLKGFVLAYSSSDVVVDKLEF